MRPTRMTDEGLAARIRDYVRGRGRASVAVSSAWLAREFQVDPRTIAASLRPYGVKPAEVERGVRGYMIADLAGLAVDGPGQPVSGQVPAGAPPAVCAECDGEGLVEVGSGEGCHDPECCSQFKTCPTCGGAASVAPVNHWSAGMTEEQIEATLASSALDRLSAGAGHDMTPALRAAGLL